MERFALHGPFWSTIRTLSSNFGSPGYLIVIIFVANWAIAARVYKAEG
ncbi:MAG: hypothetical protein M3Z30_07770 [Gemmatimonadota bacterium]|nr:hypothetical protein [Gemmatimonadota bacterium]